MLFNAFNRWTLFIITLLCLLGVGSGVKGASVEHWVQWSPLPELHGVGEGAFVGQSADVLMIAGGLESSAGGSPAYSDRIFALLPNANGSKEWREVGRLPEGMAFGAAVGGDEGLWLIGGKDAEGSRTEVIRIEWDHVRQSVQIRSDWPHLPAPASHTSATRLNRILYVAGGEMDGNPSSQFLMLDFMAERPEWRALPTWPGPALAGATLVAQGAAEFNALFLIGGLDVAGPQTGNYLYNPQTEQWHELAPMPERAQVQAAAPIGTSHILVALAGAAVPNPGFRAYHTITDTWVDVSMELPEEGEPLAFTATSAGWVHVGIAGGGLVVAEGTLASASRHFRMLDYISLTGYLSLIVLIGLYFIRRGTTTNDYFLAGNKIPWWAAGISLLATQVSSIGFMAVPAKAFATNWAYFLGVLTWFIVVPVVTRYFIPYFRSFPVASAYSYLEMRFNVQVRLFAALSFSAMQIGRLAVVLLLPALALATVTDLNLLTCIILMGAIATLYTITGGMAAVVWTDVVQAALLMTGALVAVVTVFLSLEGGSVSSSASSAPITKCR